MFIDDTDAGCPNLPVYALLWRARCPLWLLPEYSYFSRLCIDLAIASAVKRTLASKNTYSYPYCKSLYPCSVSTLRNSE